MRAVTQEEAIYLYEGMVLGHKFEDMWKLTNSSDTLLLVWMRSGGLVRLPSHLLFLLHFCFVQVQVVDLFVSSSWLPVGIENI
jgi:hypothetical protein